MSRVDRANVRPVGQPRVLITGSSRGIGLAIAREFASEGAQVCVTSRTSSTLREAARHLAREFGTDRVEAVMANLTTPDGIAEVRRFVQRRWRALDVLVLNLGSGRSRQPALASHAEWLRLLTVNLVSAAETLRVMTPLLTRGVRPSVVVVSSVAGHEWMSAPPAYGAAKAGLEHFAKSMSHILGPDGIRVNVVAPGNILFPGSTWDDKLRTDRPAVMRLLRTVPLRRLGTPEEVAQAVSFLASDRAAFISGCCLSVDGGQAKAVR